MKRVFGMFELVFDAAYLLAAVLMGLVLLARKGTAGYSLLAGAMALILAGGDAFHLAPRMQAVLTGREEALRARLGRGKQIASLSMTAFYLLLWELGQRLFQPGAGALWSAALYALAIVRVILCLLPQNRWTDRNPPVQWGIARNLPFVLIGLLVAARYCMCRSRIPALSWMWLAILLSFACYLPVVLWADKRPRLGMLMLPKTCLYLWMLAMLLAI